jgi:hypothetical protein
VPSWGFYLLLVEYPHLFLSFSSRKCAGQLLHWTPLKQYTLG